MPRWWINWFYLMIAFGIGYLVWYGGLGGIDGLSGWSSHGEHALAKAADDARLEETFAPYQGRPIDEIAQDPAALKLGQRSEEHTSELQSLMRISYAVFCLKKKKHTKHNQNRH